MEEIILLNPNHHNELDYVLQSKDNEVIHCFLSTAQSLVVVLSRYLLVISGFLVLTVAQYSVSHVVLTLSISEFLKGYSPLDKNH